MHHVKVDLSRRMLPNVDSQSSSTNKYKFAFLYYPSIFTSGQRLLKGKHGRPTVRLEKNFFLQTHLYTDLTQTKGKARKTGKNAYDTTPAQGMGFGVARQVT